MSQIVLTCPIDGLALVTQLPDAEKGDPQRDNHVHIEFRCVGECLRGHRWRANVDVTLWRNP